MARDKYGNYVNDKGVTIKINEDKNGKTHISFYDKPVNEPHSGIHVNVDKGCDSYNAKYHDEDSKDDDDTSHSGRCYLTTACMKHYADVFTDDCHELSVLRTFRDEHVNQTDIAYYYNIAPRIVAAINALPNCDFIYDKLYHSIVEPCIVAIENKDFESAYNKYKMSVLELETEFLTT